MNPDEHDVLRTFVFHLVSHFPGVSGGLRRLPPGGRSPDAIRG
ncbi:MAG TPA: hypothetical protein VF821_18915 [Lentzea sp.]